MATIKMDISEYQEMKKNAELLEEAIEEQKRLRDEIDALNQEKIKTLEAAQYSVVTIEKKTSEEIVYCLKPFHQVIERLTHFIRRYHDERLRGKYKSTRIESSEVAEFETLIDILFSKATMKPEPIETTTLTGLDEYKEIMQKEIAQSYSEEIVAKLDRLKVVESDFNKAMKKIEKKDDKINLLKEELESFKFDAELLEKADQLIEETKLHFNLMSEILNTPLNIFNYSSWKWKIVEQLGGFRETFKKLIKEEDEN